MRLTRQLPWLVFIVWSASSTAPTKIDHIRRAVSAAALSAFLLPQDFPNREYAFASTDNSAEYLIRVGMNRFRDDDMRGSISAFDEAITIQPTLARVFWQRGLSLYYANDFHACADQFRSDIALNPQDAEEIIWTAMCDAKSLGTKGNFPSLQSEIPSLPKEDQRPIMRAALAVFKGTQDVQTLLDMGDSSGRSSPEYFYSRLYAALFAEAQGNENASLKLMDDASKSVYAVTSRDYMTAVAKVHVKLRLLKATQ